LNQYYVRSWTGKYRRLTLARRAHTSLGVTRTISDAERARRGWCSRWHMAAWRRSNAVRDGQADRPERGRDPTIAVAPRLGSATGDGVRPRLVKVATTAPSNCTGE
jgi:hypothetical protein